jgi:hypothetical protein
MLAMSEITAALSASRVQLQEEQHKFEKHEYKRIKSTISNMRHDLQQAYSGYKGQTYPEIRKRLVFDAKYYYNECTSVWLDETLPTILGEEGAVLGCR